MFTGLVEEIGTIKKNTIYGNYSEIEVMANKVISDSKIGDSISTNGICLTVKEILSNGFKADVMPESMDRTNLGELKTGSRVNLERAMKSGDRFGGHIVSGHIDGVGTLKSMKKDGNATWMEIEADNEVMKYIVYKGSVALDGASLTIADVSENSFKVSIIPVTGSETILLDKRIGDTINIECDVIGKYVEKLLMGAETPYSNFNKSMSNLKSNNSSKSSSSSSSNSLSYTKSNSKIDSNFLKENGFM